MLEKTEKLESKDGLIHLIICAMITEAFLQDIKSFYAAINKPRSFTQPSTLFKKDNTTQSFRGGIALQANAPMEFIQEDELKLMTFLEGIERESPTKKYEHLINYLTPNKWNKGEDEAFKDLQRLIQLRNETIHIKSEELLLNDDNSVKKFPKAINELFVKKILTNDTIAYTSWIYILDQQSFIEWSRETVISNLLKILEILPKHPITNHIATSYKQSLMTFRFKKT
ncbi:hypothetical protein [Pseudomonas sp. R84]|uniref:hypothetical protein n=1 Tax=Pseudomonas sp. R84 TaxID=1573712 RepID=UPI00132053D9|nr:hypothetical protein [Pseudomonas sp. R84]QHC96381.1 hypothetical protein PspR84_17650 [Pseudomonas sp. R84]